ncbi:MAG TPA: superoxide dismutase family protein [Burkholderiaceae bacterium]
MIRNAPSGGAARGVRAAVAAGALLGLAGCSWGPHWGMGHAAGYGPRPAAVAQMQPRSASQVTGRVWFTQGAHHTMVHFDLSGLKPGAEHGFHLHEKGDCSAPDATSAGGHFNPGGQPHGHPRDARRHAGDLPNLRADASGVARGVFPVDRMEIDGPGGVLGRGVVVHRDPDDYRSQPAGNSGPRVACGVIAAR